MDNWLENRNDWLNPEQVIKLAKSYNSEDERLIKDWVCHTTLQLVWNKE